jgi:hypothetical protein
MQAFDLFLYALAIITVLLLRAEPTPAPVATEPADIDVDLPTLSELLTEAAEMTAKPAPTVAAAITAPAAVAVVKVATAPDYSTLKTPQLRKLCSQRGITWRNALGQNKHLPKAAMVEALLAS